MDYLNYDKKVKQGDQSPQNIPQPQKPQPQGFVDIQKKQEPYPYDYQKTTLPENVKLTQADFRFGDLETPPIPQQTPDIAPQPTHTSHPSENKTDDLFQLFPTPLFITRYPYDYSKELEFIRNSECRKPNGESDNETTIHYNRQSENTFVLDSPELVNIRNWIKSQIDQFVRNIMGSDDKLVITQSWFNKAGKGESHHEHIHPNSIVSGVWYPQINEKLPPIQFRDSNIGPNQLSVTQYNQFNSATFMLPLKMGELLIFPSTLSHSVPINQSDEERISLSFNTWAKGNLGNERSLTYLPLDRCV